VKECKSHWIGEGIWEDDRLCAVLDQGREILMKPIKKRRSGIDPFYLIIGGALLLMVVLVSLTQ
jgi:predicted nucleic acid-binding Zn ribbon protein